MTWLTPWRLRAWPTALLVGVAAVFLLQVAVAEGSVTLGGRLGGDLPAFVGAARLLRAGGDLYDPAAQAAVQADLVPGGTFCWYAWPPIVAALYLPLTFLPWKLAVLLHTVGTTTAAALGIRWWARRYGLPVAIAVPAALSFYPLLRSLPGGQLTGLLILLAAGPAWLGGALLVKPQLGLFPLVAAGRWRAFLLGGAGVYLGSAVVAGWAWPRTWVPAAMQFTHAAAADPGSVSLWDHPLPFAGVAVIAACAWRVRGDPDRRVALALAAAPLLAPHALWYDVGLAVLPLGLVAARGGRRGLPWLVGVWLIGLGMIVAPGPIGVGVLVMTCVLVAAVRAGGASGTSSSPPPPAGARTHFAENDRGASAPTPGV